jgi:hypothetical protein
MAGDAAGGSLSESLKDSVGVRNGIILVVTIVGIFAISKVELSRTAESFLGLNFAGIMGFIAYYLEQTIIPRTFRNKQLRSHMAGAAKAVNASETLKMVIDQVRIDLDHKLSDLELAIYKDANGTIPELSIKTVEHVKVGAFATFVVDERELQYEEPEGLLYLKAWYEKASQLGAGHLQRVFIVDKLDDVTDKIVQLIEDHVDRNVGVWMIENTLAESLRIDCQLDFGLFDERCLMTVQPRGPGVSSLLSVFVELPSGTNSNAVDAHRQFRKRLLARATPAHEFLHKFRLPLNAAFWNRRMVRHSPKLGPPHGVSAADARKMVDLIVEHHASMSRPLRVAILGLTPELVNACIDEQKIGTLELIDQTDVDVKLPNSGKIGRVPGNWLEYVPTETFDAILGDEVLNNLHIQQYRSFFQQTNRGLRPGGIMVLRTMARYEEVEEFSKVSKDKLLAHIKEATNESELERNARIIEFLHSSEVAFHDGSQMISTLRYNELIRGWIGSGDITVAQAVNYWFPDRENQTLYLSSADPDWLEKASRRYFKEQTFIAVDGQYCGADARLCHFYRITPFVRRD